SSARKGTPGPPAEGRRPNVPIRPAAARRATFPAQRGSNGRFAAGPVRSAEDRRSDIPIRPAAFAAGHLPRMRGSALWLYEVVKHSLNAGRRRQCRQGGDRGYAQVRIRRSVRYDPDVGGDGGDGPSGGGRRATVLLLLAERIVSKTAC